mgnify:CR=1 FL=1|tara:strand:+ start:3682 stop:4062 length:381 start_codon:yes stop_codon:yes gene_type:complete
MLQILTPLFNLGSTIIEGQINKSKAKATLAQTEAEAKAEVMKTAATHDSKWELIMAESTKGSWKDELVTVVVLIPVILCFVPGMEEIVKNGFNRLSELPDWYQYLVFLVCSAALGIKGLDKFRRKK